MSDYDDERADWFALARCRETDHKIYFPGAGAIGRISSAAAIKICKQSCPVIEQCLNYAVTKDIEFGVWGGTTSVTRKRIKNEERRREKQMADGC